MDQPEKFLYGYRGPWPSQCAVTPESSPPVAVLLPDAEMQTYRRKVLRRFLRQRWTGRPAAWLHAFRHPSLDPVSDEQFTQALTDTAFSRMLNPILDPVDEQTFADELHQIGDGEPFKVDLTAMGDIETFPGVYCSPSVTLLVRDRDGHFHPSAISLPGIILRPADGEAWELAKYFVLQGASHHLIALIHPRLHFPLNPANALAKTVLPKDHVLLNLLLPHLEVQLGLESGVLFTSRSVLHNRQDELYAPFCCEGKGNFTLVNRGYYGIPGNSSYPAYRYEHGVGTIHSGYGVFLDRYYQTILSYCRKVVTRIAPCDHYVRRWASHCATFIPGFPDQNAIADPETLAAAAATIICTNSICHTSDHHYYTGPSFNQMPLRMRVAPPTSRSIPSLNRRKLVHREDLARHYLANEMFFRPTVLTKMTDAKYNFMESELQQLSRQFQDDLHATERDMPVRRYVPLDAMASSIQF